MYPVCIYTGAGACFVYTAILKSWMHKPVVEFAWRE